MASTYTLISSNVLASSAASVTFSAIPATYTDLVLRASVRGDSAATAVNMKVLFNNDTTTNYSVTAIYNGGGTPADLQVGNTASPYSGLINADTSTSNTFSNIEVYVPSYNSINNKPLSTAFAPESNSAGGTGYENWIAAQLYRGSSAITRIDCILNGGNIMATSSFYLYGISNA
jgi:hypothetical protein